MNGVLEKAQGDISMLRKQDYAALDGLNLLTLSETALNHYQQTSRGMSGCPDCGS
jgi:hypothetical protein